ncbi:hypothetical protein GCM10027569_20480 [Flindersiella endophytica]
MIGIIVGAAAVSGISMATASQSSSFNGSDKKLAAPAKLGDYVKFADAKFNEDADSKAAVERTATWSGRSADRLSESYDGAASLVQVYSDDKHDSTFSVQMVRASAPYPIYVPYTDPKALGIVKPQREEKRFGDVSCELYNQLTPAGKQPAKNSTATTLCRRTESGLTVEITNVTGDLGHRPEQVAKLVDEAWSSVS